MLEHLGKAYGGTAYILDKCVADGAPKGVPPSWRQRLSATMVVDPGLFAVRRESSVDDRPGRPAPVKKRWRWRAARSVELDAAAQRCADTFGANVRVANHPILGGFTVHQWRRFHWVHTRHHIRQIAQRRR